MTKEKRLPLLTWLQVLGCALVIFGHSFPFVAEYPTWLYQLRAFIYSFHMPLFIFCSGVLLVVSEASSHYTFLQYLKRRAARLLMPYLVLSLLGIVPKILLSPVLNDSLNMNFGELVRAFLVPRSNIWGHFWFLPLIFFCGLLGYGADVLRKKNRIWMPLLLLISVGLLFAPNLTAWFGVDDLLGSLFYFFLGMSCAGSVRQADELKFQYKLPASILLFGCAALLFIASFKWQQAVPATILSTLLACAMIAGLALIVSCFTADREMPKHKLWYRTFSVFILSWPCQLVAELLTEHVLRFPYYLVMPAMLTAGLAGPVILILVIDRLEKNHKHRILTKLIGG